MAEASILGMKITQFGFTNSTDLNKLMQTNASQSRVLMIPANTLMAIRNGLIKIENFELARPPHAQGLVGTVKNAYVITDAYLPPTERWRNTGGGEVHMVGRAIVGMSDELKKAVENVIFD